MKVLVCVKPGFNAEAEISISGNEIISSDNNLVINPFDEYAVEAAVQLKESYEAQVTVLTVGPIEEDQALRHSLAMGADDAVLIEIQNQSNFDSKSTARLICAFYEQHPEFDLIIFGRQTIETGSGLLPAQFARMAGLPFLGLAGKIEIGADIVIDRILDDKKLRVSSSLPAVTSVVQSIGEPRYPSFMGIRKAKNADILIWKPETDLLLSPDLQSLNIQNAIKVRSECVFIQGKDPRDLSQELVRRIMGEKIL